MKLIKISSVIAVLLVIAWVYSGTIHGSDAGTWYANRRFLDTCDNNAIVYVYKKSGKIQLSSKTGQEVITRLKEVKIDNWRDAPYNGYYDLQLEIIRKDGQPRHISCWSNQAPYLSPRARSDIGPWLAGLK